MEGQTAVATNRKGGVSHRKKKGKSRFKGKKEMDRALKGGVRKKSKRASIDLGQWPGAAPEAPSIEVFSTRKE